VGDWESSGGDRGAMEKTEKLRGCKLPLRIPSREESTQNGDGVGGENIDSGDKSERLLGTTNQKAGGTLF